MTTPEEVANAALAGMEYMSISNGAAPQRSYSGQEWTSDYVGENLDGSGAGYPGSQGGQKHAQQPHHPQGMHSQLPPVPPPQLQGQGQQAMAASPYGNFGFLSGHAPSGLPGLPGQLSPFGNSGGVMPLGVQSQRSHQAASSTVRLPPFRLFLRQEETSPRKRVFCFEPHSSPPQTPLKPPLRLILPPCGSPPNPSDCAPPSPRSTACRTACSADSSHRWAEVIRCSAAVSSTAAAARCAP